MNPDFVLHPMSDFEILKMGITMFFVMAVPVLVIKSVAIIINRMAQDDSISVWLFFSILFIFALGWVYIIP